MGAIKIKGSTSGSTTITAPATGSDETIELSTALASKLPYSYGTATPSTTDSGFLWYDSNSTPAAPKFWDGAAFQALTSGKILQVVRATDGTNRSVTSGTYVDVTGMSVTITPTKSTSAIIVTCNFFVIGASSGDNTLVRYQITDSSNNAVSGTQAGGFGSANLTGTSTRNFYASPFLIGYATPATTSAVTYKLRAYVDNAATTTATFANGTAMTGQLFALEIGA